MPFVWGPGVMAAGVLLVVRRGAGMTGLVGSVLGLLSGAYAPVTQFPDWMQSLSEGNPVAVVLDAVREVLLGWAGWGTVADALPLLAGASVVTPAMGAAVFRPALRHEQQNGRSGSADVDAVRAWSSADRLIDAPPSIATRRRDRVEALAVRRFRATGRPIPDAFRVTARQEGARHLTAPIVLRRVRVLLDGPKAVEAVPGDGRRSFATRSWARSTPSVPGRAAAECHRETWLSACSMVRTEHPGEAS